MGCVQVASFKENMTFNSRSCALELQRKHMRIKGADFKTVISGARLRKGPQVVQAEALTPLET